MSIEPRIVYGITWRGVLQERALGTPFLYASKGAAVGSEYPVPMGDGEREVVELVLLPAEMHDLLLKDRNDLLRAIEEKLAADAELQQANNAYSFCLRTDGHFDETEQLAYQNCNEAAYRHELALNSLTALLSRVKGGTK